MIAARIGKPLLCLWMVTLLLLAAACGNNNDSENLDRQALAEKFLRGVYTGNPVVVDELAAEDIVISYPVFQEIYGTPAIRGRDAVKKFGAGFSQRWLEPQITIHQAISEGQSVAMIWSFSAVDARAAAGAARQSWGGISVYRFNDSGKIAVEFGEESAPGPTARLAMKAGGT